MKTDDIIKEIDKAVNELIEQRNDFRSKTEIAIEFLDRLSHWDMLWTGKGQPSLVADGPYWKKEIEETLKKLKE
jgi:hypothetical protein